MTKDEKNNWPSHKQTGGYCRAPIEAKIMERYFLQLFHCNKISIVCAKFLIPIGWTMAFHILLYKVSAKHLLNLGDIIG
jgi:hypothetical protein